MFQNTLALKLNEDEFGVFVRAYKESENLDETVKSAANYTFKRCNASGAFVMYEIAPEEAAFMTFASFAKDPEPIGKKRVFVVPARRQMKTLAGTFNGLYRSFSDVEREMKENLGEWMPDDFTWEDHIGIIDGGSAVRIDNPTRAQKRALIKEALKREPQLSDRQIAAKLRCDHKTVGSVRKEAVRCGEIIYVSHVIDTIGRVQPRKKQVHIKRVKPKKASCVNTGACYYKRVSPI